MDKFAIGAIVIAAIIEAFIWYAAKHNPQENTQNLVVASMLPAVLVGTVLLFWFLQRGET